jgi:hypothetical protein
VASGDWLTRKIVTIGALAGAAVCVGTLLFLYLGAHGTVDAFGRALGTDFSVFWNAGHLANTGHAVDAWNVDKFNDAAFATHQAKVPASAWLYPPVFLFVAATLALLPYVAALISWQLASLAIAGLALASVLKDRRAALIALASPLTPLLLAHGQNAFLTAGLLGFGLVLLNRRPAVAGGCFGLLVYKPQLALMLGPLLLLGRHWRAIASAAVVALTLIGASTLIWGVESWQAFLATLPHSRQYMESGITDFYRSASLFAAARRWGASVPLAYCVQAVGFSAGLLIIFATRKSVSNLRNAAVCVAATLSTPYLLDYDMALAGFGAAFLYAEGVRSGFRSYEKSILAFVWVGPWFARPASLYLWLPLGATATVLLATMIARRSALWGPRPNLISCEPGSRPQLHGSAP